MHELIVLALNLTNRCNLACVHCGCDPRNASQENELPAAFFLEQLAIGQTLGAQQVNITGGEAFVRNDTFELVAGALAMGYFVSMESNGTLLDTSNLDWLASQGENVRLSLSMDGFNSETNDAIRGKGTFDKVMRTARLASEKRVNARIITVLHSGNIGQIPQMARYFVEELGLGFRLIPNILEYGRGVYACNTHGANYDQVTKILNNFYFDFLREKQSDKLSVELPTALMPVDIDHHHICPWGQSMIGIGPSGIVSLCHVSNNDERFIFADLKETTLNKVWLHNEKLATFRNLNPDNLHGVCGNCLAREICRGGCRLHSIAKSKGDFLAPEPVCQTVYELGKFPEYALENEQTDCHYEYPVEV